MKKNVAAYVLDVGADYYCRLYCLILCLPNNPLYLRIKNIFSGRDTSFKGRASDSFHLACCCPGKKYIFWYRAWAIKINRCKDLERLL